MKNLNWEIILSNLAEAREQIEKIEQQVEVDQKLSEGELQIALEHVYHHLNVAWHVRHIPTDRYARMKDEDFNLWSKYPREIEEWVIDPQI